MFFGIGKLFLRKVNRQVISYSCFKITAIVNLQSQISRINYKHYNDFCGIITIKHIPKHKNKRNFIIKIE